ncbi:MAG TPA: InlB B-repeat-containing protein [Spirochaetota bacterium]|nr:InlB B-repeat-containing protein [Spirochaetota bacterium]
MNSFPSTIINKSLIIIISVSLILPVSCRCSSEKKNVTVAFNSRDGDIINSITLRKGDLLPSPPTPLKYKHSFHGWYRDTAFTNPWNFKTGRIKSDMILYAKWTYHGEPETFNDKDRPAYIYNSKDNYYLCKPWNYNKKENLNRKYPLFIYLHGAGSPGTPDILPCFISDSDKQKYPCFVYLPHTSGSWDNKKLISQIENIKSLYRMDQNRIYLMGHSMGGSTSYSLANEYYNMKKQLFAAIVRMAGQSQATVLNEIAEQTSVWYYIGLSDTKLRVDIARESFKFLKEYPDNADALEITDSAHFSKYRRRTWTLIKKGMEIVKYTEYKFPVGHGISHIPLKDPYLLEWLFGQSLKKR